MCVQSSETDGTEADAAAPRAQARKELPMNFEDLTPEQLEKANACTSVEELFKLAVEEGVELTDEQMEALSGGGEVINTFGKGIQCKSCKKGFFRKTGNTRPGKIFGDLWPDIERKCNYCGITKWFNG